MSRYFLEIAFNGGAYHGWQRQPAANSVQAEMERALRLVLRREKVDVLGCGRTDTGVHATSYFLHFDHPDEEVLDERTAHSLNGVLPHDIAVKRIFSVAADAHARFSAVERGYTYRIHAHKDPFRLGLSYLLHPPLDVDAMNEACAILVGKKDFSSFCKAGSDTRTMTCDLRQAYWEKDNDGYRFTIRADRFLRNMVRAIVGTSIRIGRGQQAPASLHEVLAAKDRQAAGLSAPACGLSLDLVVYPFVRS